MRVTLLAAVGALALIAGFASAAPTTPFPATGDDALRTDANAVFKALPSIQPVPPRNAITREKLELGKMLFFDPRISSSHLLSCNTCHNVGMGGVDGLETSVGHGWQKGPRNAPTIFNSFFNVAQFWDGRAEDLRTQAKGPIQAAVEMNATPDRVMEVLRSIPEYQERFKVAFAGEAEPMTFDNVAKAIEVFEATMITPSARFDQFLEGNLTALNATEKTGLRLFMDKGCVSCHNGVNIGGADYYPFGVVERPGAEILPPGDKGRFSVTATATDEYVFRAPSLRNVALTAPYFHTGKVWDLQQAVHIMGTSQLGTELTDDEVGAVVAFLGTLTGEQPNVSYPLLPPSSATTPRPMLMMPPSTTAPIPGPSPDPAKK